MSTYLLYIILLSSSALAYASSVIYKKSVYSLPLTFDPIQMNDTASLVVSHLIYDGLLKFTPTMGIEGALAESWSTSKDGKTLTFKLKKNIYFHDGTPIRPEDVIFSIRRAASKESIVRKYYESIKTTDSSLKAESFLLSKKSNQEIEIHLKYPSPGFINILAGTTAKILPERLAKNSNFFKKPIGSGPFQWSEFSEVEKILKLRSSKKYYYKEIFIDELWLLATDETEAKKMALLRQVDDLANWPLAKNDPVFKLGRHISAPVAATWIIGLNTKKSPFNSEEVRRNFKLSFDHEKFRQEFYPDSLPSHGYIPPGLPGHSKYKNKLVQNKSRFIPPKEKIEITIPVELSAHKEIKNHIESSLTKLGWKVEVSPLEWGELMKGYKKKSLQSFLVAMNMDYPDTEFLLRNFHSKNPDNFSQLNSSETDTLLDELREENDRKKRKDISERINSILDVKAVTVNLFHPKAHYWTSDCVTGFVPNMLSDVYIDYTTVKKIGDCR
jgi:ABC-type transport system substrate-binding protein